MVVVVLPWFTVTVADDELGVKFESPG